MSGAPSAPATRPRNDGGQGADPPRALDPAALAAAAGAVPDPEIPVVTLADLGILRRVEVSADGCVTATITPTYSGCPAMDAIRADLAVALRGAGAREVRVETQLAPAWSTDDITENGRRKLREFGIAPPGPVRGPIPIPIRASLPVRGAAPRVACPRCGSTRTRELARFGSTACKALWVCDACAEPFDYFKPL